MVQDLYILMITAAVVSILFKLLKQPVVLGYIVAGRHRCAVCTVLHRSGVPSEEPHQQRQGGCNWCVDNHRRHDALWLPCGSGC